MISRLSTLWDQSWLVCLCLCPWLGGSFWHLSCLSCTLADPLVPRVDFTLLVEQVCLPHAHALHMAISGLQLKAVPSPSLHITLYATSVVDPPIPLFPPSLLQAVFTCLHGLCQLVSSVLNSWLGTNSSGRNESWCCHFVYGLHRLTCVQGPAQSSLPCPAVHNPFGCFHLRPCGHCRTSSSYLFLPSNCCWLDHKVPRSSFFVLHHGSHLCNSILQWMGHLLWHPTGAYFWPGAQLTSHQWAPHSDI